MGAYERMRKYKIQYWHDNEDYWVDILELSFAAKLYTQVDAIAQAGYVLEHYVWVKGSSVRVINIETNEVVAQYNMRKINGEEEAQPEPAAITLPIAG